MIYNLTNNRQLLFLHIPRTAGTSIASWIRDRDVSYIDYKEYDSNNGHLGLGLLKSQLSMPYKSFTVVRNPWDRLVSAYFHTIFLQDTHESYKFSISTFEDFIFKLKTGLSIGNPNLYQLQVDWITSPLDYILKYENLAQEFTVIQDYVGNTDPLPIENTREEFSSVKKLPYQEYYNNNTRKTVEEICQKDILEFGYTFND
jgi:hypothetical protein